jgi:hypothetical protein
MVDVLILPAPAASVHPRRVIRLHCLQANNTLLLGILLTLRLLRGLLLLLLLLRLMLGPLVRGLGG